MKSSTKSFLAGIGTALAIYPSSDYSQFVPKESASERMNQNWAKTGNYIRTAMAEYQISNEHTTKIKAKATGRAQTKG